MFIIFSTVAVNISCHEPEVAQNKVREKRQVLQILGGFAAVLGAGASAVAIADSPTTYKLIKKSEEDIQRVNRQHYQNGYNNPFNIGSVGFRKKRSVFSENK